MDVENHLESSETLQMLAPPPGSFIDREELIQYVGDFAVSQGYVVTIKQSKKDRVVILGCDRGGVYRNRRKANEESSTEQIRKRKASTRMTNCPFELIGKKEGGVWLLGIRNGSHNHEPIKDLSEHPSSRRFSENEVLRIKEMTDAGLKPRQILKKLKQTNPELLSTPKQLYNVKTKLRQGNFTVRNIKSLRAHILDSGNPDPSTIIELSWKQRNPPRVPNVIGGRFVDSKSSACVDVFNPATKKLVSQVPLTSTEEFKAAVFSAKRAFPSWRAKTLSARQLIMFKFQELIRRDIDKLSLCIVSEHGKTLKDAYDEVYRGQDAVDHACGLASLQMGEFFSNVPNGTDTYSIREPLGLCAGICPFSFPAMIPLWLFPFAVTCGNTFILKPSEKAPRASLMLAELVREAGFPNGVLNIVHGTNDIVDNICDDENIKAISFVGSNIDGMYIYERASAKGKRVQSNTGVRNHAVVMPDANIDATINALVAAGFGAAGQKCLALSTVVFVADSESWEQSLVECSKALRLNAGTEPDANLGPVNSKQMKERIYKFIESSVENGAKLLLDGRDKVVPGYEKGDFIGPTILSDITTDMACYKVDNVGPVLLCLRANSLEEAINIVNGNKHPCGASIFTTSGIAARKFQSEITAGQIGINVALPIPLPFFSVTGPNASFTGDLSFFGQANVHFYTQMKMVTQQWGELHRDEEVQLLMPTSDIS